MPIAPDIAIQLDIVLATDTPDMATRGDIRLSGGPAMSLYSFHGRGTLNGTIPHPALVKLPVIAARPLPILAILAAAEESDNRDFNPSSTQGHTRPQLDIMSSSVLTGAAALMLIIRPAVMDSGQCAPIRFPWGHVSPDHVSTDNVSTDIVS
jgi:hypothetical protein